MTCIQVKKLLSEKLTVFMFMQLTLLTQLFKIMFFTLPAVTLEYIQITLDTLEPAYVKKQLCCLDTVTMLNRFL